MTDKIYLFSPGGTACFTCIFCCMCLMLFLMLYISGQSTETAVSVCITVKSSKRTYLHYTVPQIYPLLLLLLLLLLQLTGHLSCMFAHTSRQQRPLPSNRCCRTYHIDCIPPIANQTAVCVKQHPQQPPHRVKGLGVKTVKCYDTPLDLGNVDCI